MSNGAAAIIAGHADFAAAMISAVAQITGRGETFVPMTNRGMSAEDIERAMRALVEEQAVRVIFTDLPAGSCTIAARRLVRSRPEIVLVTGVNLAALLDFAFHSELAPPEAAARAVEKAKAAVTVVGTGRAD